MTHSNDDLPVCPLMQETEGAEFGWEHVPVDYEGKLAYLHVVPRHDIRLHQLDPTCWCDPFGDPDHLEVVIHNSADGRERYETGGSKPS